MIGHYIMMELGKRKNYPFVDKFIKRFSSNIFPGIVISYY